MHMQGAATVKVETRPDRQASFGRGTMVRMRLVAETCAGYAHQKATLKHRICVGADAHVFRRLCAAGGIEGRDALPVTSGGVHEGGLRCAHLTMH